MDHRAFYNEPTIHITLYPWSSWSTYPKAKHWQMQNQPLKQRNNHKQCDWNSSVPLVFGDLRSSNVMITETKQNKLIDFNWAGEEGPLPDALGQRVFKRWLLSRGLMTWRC